MNYTLGSVSLIVAVAHASAFGSMPVEANGSPVSAIGFAAEAPDAARVDPRYVAVSVASSSRAVPLGPADSYNVQDYGAVCDWDGRTGTDSTEAIQAAINAAGTNGGTVFLPACPRGLAYRITRLWFQHDALHNPRFPLGAQQSRGFTFRGAGQAGDLNIHPSFPANLHKSTLVSTDAKGPALIVDGGVGHGARAIVIDGINVVASNSTSVVLFKGANTGSSIRNSAFQQGGTGHGVDVDSAWMMAFEKLLIQNGRTPTNPSSVGFRIRSSVGGGQVALRDIMVTRAWGTNREGCESDPDPEKCGGWGIGLQLGAVAGEAPYDSQAIFAIECSSCLAQHGRRGIVIGKLRGATLVSPYTEGNRKHAVNITNRGGPVKIVGALFGDDQADEGVVVVDAATAGTPIHGVTIENSMFSQVKNYGVRLVDGTWTSGAIRNNWFVRDGKGRGYGIAIATGGFPAPWSVEGNVYDSYMGGGMTPYDDASKITHRAEIDGTTTSLYVAGGRGPPEDSRAREGDFFFRSDGPLGSDTRLYVKQDGHWIPLRTEPALAPPRYTPRNGTVLQLDSRTSTQFIISATAGVTNITVGQPHAAHEGRVITITVENANAAASGRVTTTFDPAYFRMGAWTDPAPGFNRSVTFRFSRGLWREIGRGTVDVPN